MADPIRVLLVEDNDVFRQALEVLLGLEADIQVVGAVADGTDAPDIARDVQPDVVLMDYRLPGLDGVQATSAVREACPAAAVVCLTAEATSREREALYDAGAVACLTKDDQLERIVAAVRSAGERNGG